MLIKSFDPRRCVVATAEFGETAMHEREREGLAMKTTPCCSLRRRKSMKISAGEWERNAAKSAALSLSCHQAKNDRRKRLESQKVLAEREGFEPSKGF